MLYEITQWLGFFTLMGLYHGLDFSKLRIPGSIVFYSLFKLLG